MAAAVLVEAVKSITDMYFYAVFWAIFLPLVVAVNDIFAYLCGMAFGKHKLIILSPKKTHEGFWGGAFFTLIFTFFTVSYLHKFERLTCTTTRISLYPFEPIECVPSKVFELRQVEVPLFGQIEVCDAQIVSCIFGLFTSLVAPFAGFLASGIKRASGLKDFGNLIPGHGGIIDRYDCFIAVALFSSILLRKFLYSDEILLEKVASKITYSNFPTEQLPQLVLWLSETLDSNYTLSP